MTDQDDVQQYLKMQKAGRALVEPGEGQTRLRVAIVADHAPQQYTSVLKAAIAEFGVFPDVYEADYGTAALEAFDRDSELRRSRPEAVFYSICVQKYRARYLEAETSQQRETLPETYLSEIMGVVDALAEGGATVFVSNFALPIERQFGNFGLHTRQSLYGSVLEFNALLTAEIRKRRAAVIVDIMYIANRVGAERFFDERLWISAKYPCANRFLPAIARSAARALMVRKARVSKVLVLDLDNTLWGGVIGDDGMEGIRLGGDALGEAFQSFQWYAKSLKQRGYVLAVCSKNNEATAMEAFRNHPEMVLREEDVAVFVINWNDKASNIEYISRVLNLGLDSFIFVDDMPFERDLVRTRLPMVGVPELPEDPSDYVAAIERSGLLEGTGFTAEDSQRSDAYRVEALRTTEQIKYGSIDEYLASLHMKAECRLFRKEDVQRVAQLIQRSNQFNLRTQRISEAQCEEYRADGQDKFGMYVRLADRFGDYGLIAVICCDVTAEELFITELVMSCRVLKRGVESLIMNALFVECEKRGLKGLRGEYIASPKNSMVKEFFTQFNFKQVAQDEKKTVWFMPTSDYTSNPVFIKVENND